MRIEWEKSQSDAQKLEEAGFGGMAAPAPDMCDLATQALHCWHFCNGWAPERWATYGALYPVPDWHQLIDSMAIIKGQI